MNKRNSSIFVFIGGLLVTILLLAILGSYIVFTRYFSNPTSVSTTLPTQTDFFDLSTTKPPFPVETSSYDERFNLAQPFINDALQKTEQENFQDAVNSWDKALELVPDYADGHYQRGLLFLQLLENEHSLETNNMLLGRAHEDIDLAIILNPYGDGNYYFARYRIYDYLAALQENRPSYISFEEVALDNLLASYQLGTTASLANRNILFVYYNLGRCDEMSEEIQKQIAAQSEPSATLDLAMGLHYYCKGDFENALKRTTEAVRVGKEKNLMVGYCQRSFSRTEVLFSMKKYDDALDEINDTINKSPYFCGERYYLRSLIYANMGDIDNAEKDIEFGMGQTWSRGGLLSYAQAKVAMAKGDTKTAILLLQDAEATYQISGPILRLIQEELEKLGGERLEIPLSMPISTPFTIKTP